MSRSRSRHLERDADVAAVVEEQTGPSRGDCPGDCNVVHRAQLRKWKARVARELDAVLDAYRVELVAQGRGDDAVAAALLEVDLDAVRLEAEALASERVTVPAPVPGRPVWCLPCSGRIRILLERIPRLVVLTLDVGHVPPARRPDRSPVTSPVRVLDAVTTSAGETVEGLACGHRRTWRGWGPSPERRVCLTCVAGAIVPSPGRLAPGEKVARAGGRSPVSPALSVSWLEADAAIQWVCSTADALAYALGVRGRSWEWRSGSSADRVRAAHAATRFLLAHLKDVLALPDPLPKSFGVSVAQVSGRLLTTSGERLLVHDLPDPCPRCERRGMQREDGGSLVGCRACGAHWDEAHFEHLSRAAAAAAAPKGRA